MEISTPLGQMFPFARTEFFPTNVQMRIDLTVSDTYKTDMFYTQRLRGEAGAVALKLADNAIHQTAGARSTSIT